MSLCWKENEPLICLSQIWQLYIYISTSNNIFQHVLFLSKQEWLHWIKLVRYRLILPLVLNFLSWKSDNAGGSSNSCAKSIKEVTFGHTCQPRDSFGKYLVLLDSFKSILFTKKSCKLDFISSIYFFVQFKF